MGAGLLSCLLRVSSLPFFTLSIRRPEEPTKKTVLVGRALAGGVIVMFEIEPAKSMWMPAGKTSKWMEHAPRAA